MPFPVAPRLDVAPLFAIAGTHHNDVRLAERLKTTPKALRRWRSAGSVPLFSADRACAALNVHPMSVWGDDWLDT